jgi:hypothetical protein
MAKVPKFGLIEIKIRRESSLSGLVAFAVLVIPALVPNRIRTIKVIPHVIRDISNN